MTEVLDEHIGAIDVADLARLCDIQGYEWLPYPFTPTGLPGLPGTGDLSVFRPWLDAYAGADIWLECRVLHSCDTVADTRISAVRADEAGFCAVQRTDADVIDVYRLSAYDLGSAVSASVTLAGPGRLPRITVPKYVDYFVRPHEQDGDDYPFLVLEQVTARTSDAGATSVPNAQVAALGTVQSRCSPAPHWGMDWDSELVVWVQIEDDGDHVYQSDFDHAVPVTRSQLVRRIDRLIAADVAALRRRRGSG